MADVGSIGGLPSPQRPDETARVDAERRRLQSGQSGDQSTGDGVAISSEARRAAEALRFAEFARAEPDLREDPVQAARERLEQGVLDEPATVRRAVERLLDEIV